MRQSFSLRASLGSLEISGQASPPPETDTKQFAATFAITTSAQHCENNLLCYLHVQSKTFPATKFVYKVSATESTPATWWKKVKACRLVANLHAHVARQ